MSVRVFVLVTGLLVMALLAMACAVSDREGESVEQLLTSEAQLEPDEMGAEQDHETPARAHRATATGPQPAATPTTDPGPRAQSTPMPTALAPTNDGETVTGSPTVSSLSDPHLEQLVEQAKADLARQLSLPADQIKLIEAMRVDWPNSSMGCPEPGGEYLDVWVVGELIQLEAGGRVYEYHSGPNRPPFLCPPSK